MASAPAYGPDPRRGRARGSRSRRMHAAQTSIARLIDDGLAATAPPRAAAAGEQHRAAPRRLRASGARAAGGPIRAGACRCRRLGDGMDVVQHQEPAANPAARKNVSGAGESGGPVPIWESPHPHLASDPGEAEDRRRHREEHDRSSHPRVHEREDAGEEARAPRVQHGAVAGEPEAASGGARRGPGPPANGLRPSMMRVDRHDQPVEQRHEQDQQRHHDRPSETSPTSNLHAIVIAAIRKPTARLPASPRKSDACGKFRGRKASRPPTRQIEDRRHEELARCRPRSRGSTTPGSRRRRRAGRSCCR